MIMIIYGPRRKKEEVEKEENMYRTSRDDCSFHAKLIKNVYIFMFLDFKTTSNDQKS